MEIIVKGTEGIDIPHTENDEEFYKLQNAMEQNIRRRLQLRTTDEVTFRFKATPKPTILE